MAKKIEGYEPLLLRRGKGSLWLGEDHLLIIECQTLFLTYSEVYRRLDYNNIQAIMHAKSRRGAWQTAALALLVVFFGWMMAMMDSFGPGMVMTIFAAIFLALLLVHLFRGPSARMVIQTAVKAWRLPVVTRRKQAEMVMSALMPLCEKAQENLAPQITADDSSHFESKLASVARPQPPVMAGPNATNVPIHALAVPAWICLLIFAAMAGGELAWNTLFATFMMMAFGVAALVLLLICFGRGGGVRATGGGGVFTVAMVTLGLNALVGFIIGIAGIFMEPDYYAEASDFETQQYMFREISNFPTGHADGLVAFVALLALVTGVTALIGLLAAIQQGKRIHHEEYAVDDSES